MVIVVTESEVISAVIVTSFATPFSSEPPRASIAAGPNDERAATAAYIPIFINAIPISSVVAFAPSLTDTFAPSLTDTFAP